MPVYRYKLAGVSLDEIKAQIPQADVGSLSAGDSAADLYWDITVNASAKSDLDAFMANLGWTYESTDPTTDVDEDSASEFEKYGGTGRKTPEHPLSIGGANQLDVAAGVGVIGIGGVYADISWGGTSINTTGFAEGAWYVYVDNSGTVQTSLSEPDGSQYIRLGGFYYSGSEIGDYEQDPARVDSFMSRVHDFGRLLGAFVANNAGLIQEDTTDLKVVSPAFTARYGLESYNLTEIDSDDAGTRFFCWFKSADDDWSLDYHWLASEDGKIPTDRWNDTTQNNSTALSANCTFTNGSTNVPTASDLTTEVSPGDYVWLDADGITYMNRVASINASAITLEVNYGGAGGPAGAASVGKALPNLTAGKWVKHLLLRTRSDGMHLFIGQEEFDTEDDARAAGAPDLPVAVSQGTLKMAFVMVQQGDTAIGNGLIDIRPLPFHDTIGGSQGAGVVTVHGDLSGLGADDHTQYHNDTRGDARYYTKTSFITTSTGAPDAGKPIKLDAAGHVDATMVNDADVDHALIGNVTANQHHSQVHGLGSSDHSSSTIAALNALITDATLDDSSASRPPNGSAGGDLSGSYPTPSIVQANVDHTQISNIGTNTHAQIDTHISVAVTAAIIIADNALVRGDGGARGVQSSGVTLDDTDKLVIPGTGALQIQSLGAGVVQTDASGNFSSAQLTHSQLGSVTSDQHHAQLHAPSHGHGQPDAVKLDDLASPDDNTDLNASVSAHGLLPKLGGGTVNFLRADGTWATPAVTPLTSTAPVNVTKVAAQVGVGTEAARNDHKHDVSTAAPGAVGVGTTSGEGSATTLARSDHSHLSNTAPSDVTKAAAAIGTSGQPARADHKHDVTTATPSGTAVRIGNTAAQGTATTLARSDHIHTVTGGTPVNVTKSANAAGSAVTFARSDHKHDITTAIASAQAPGDTASEGSATSIARSDHKHSLPAYGSSSATICQGNDSRLSDARTPTSHAPSHQHNGSDEVGTATPAANAIPKADGSGKLNSWVDATGDVFGPASAVDGAAALYDGTTGKLIKNSLLNVNSSGYVGIIDAPYSNAALRTRGIALPDFGVNVGATTSYDDYDIGIYTNFSFHSATGDFEITGLANTAQGKVVIIHNVTDYTLTLRHEDAGSTTTSRFDLPGDEDIALEPNGAVTLTYCVQGPSSRWRVASSVGATETTSYGTTVSAWTSSGGRYYADITHNLNTNDVFVEAYRTADNTTVLLDDIERTSTNVVRVWVVAQETLRVMVTVGGGAGVGGGVDTDAFHDGGESKGAARSLGNNDAYGLTIKTNNAARITIQDDGDIGFGIASPLARFHAEGSSPGQEVFVVRGASGQTENLFEARQSDNSVKVAITAAGNVELDDTDVTGVRTIQFSAEYDNGNSGSADTINWNNAQKQKSTLTANCTYTFTAPSGGIGNFLLKVVQDPTGGRTVTWPASVKWPNGTPPTLSTGPNDIDIVSFYWDGTNYFGVASLDFA